MSGFLGSVGFVGFLGFLEGSSCAKAPTSVTRAEESVRPQGRWQTQIERELKALVPIV